MGSLFSCCDDASPETLSQVLKWGPAHTTLATLGSKLKSDGRPLTAVDWRANRLADAAAKLAAHSVRVPWEVREKYEYLGAAHLYGAALAGAACRAANNHMSSQPQPDGSVKQVRSRDSIGRPPQKAPGATRSPQQTQKQRSAKGRPSPQPELAEALPKDFPVASGAMALPMAAAFATSASVPDRVEQRSRTCSRAGETKNRIASRKPAKRSRLGEQRSHAISAAALANRLSCQQ
jgi:hypothetical protein